MSRDVNLRRAAAIRRHRSNPAIVAALKESIRTAARADLSSKHIGIMVGLSAGKACHWLHALGFRRMYVTAEERAAVMRMRQEADAAERKEAA